MMRYSRKQIRNKRICKKVWEALPTVLTLILFGAFMYFAYKIYTSAGRQSYRSSSTRYGRGAPEKKKFDAGKVLADLFSQVQPGADYDGIISRVESVRRRTKGEQDERVAEIYDAILWTAEPVDAQLKAYEKLKEVCSDLDDYARLMAVYEKLQKTPSRIAVILNQHLEMIDAYIAKKRPKRARKYAEILAGKLPSVQDEIVKNQFQNALEERMAILDQSTNTDSE